VPLILAFHGLGSNATQQEAYTGMSASSDAPGGGYIVAYPEGVPLSGGTQHWNTTLLPPPEPNDVAFVDQLITALSNQLCIDHTRVYATGMSNGGMMSSRLACSLSERIAAVAPVAGAYYPPVFTFLPNETCEDTRPVPFIAFHGTEDNTVPWDGGPGLGGAVFRLPIDNDTADDDVMQSWSGHNGCTSGRQEQQATANVRLISYTGCDDEATVQLYAVDGGGHTWPDATVGQTTHEINANDLMWEFFQDHPLGGPAQLTPSPTPTPKNPALDTDGDTVPNNADLDDDADGCLDTDEEQVTKLSYATGGWRNPHNFWDFFDVWTHPQGNPSGWERNRVVTVSDVLAVGSRFGPGALPPDPFAAALTPPSTEMGYHTAYDRGAIIGADSWDRAPPDGTINIADDILGAAAQFNHNCT
jgi:polyhydroxybutyrate depolymerase